MAFESMFHALLGKSIYCCFTEEVFGTAFTPTIDRAQKLSWMVMALNSFNVDTLVVLWALVAQ